MTMTPRPSWQYDNLIIDKESYNIVVKGQKMEIPPKEIELLYFLASSPNRVFTRSQLLDDVWGLHYFGGHPHSGCAHRAFCGKNCPVSATNGS